VGLFYMCVFYICINLARHRPLITNLKHQNQLRETFQSHIKNPHKITTLALEKHTVLNPSN